MTVTTRRAASPYARRLARERGLALTSLTGTGPGGRIVAADIEAFIAAPPAKTTASAVAAVSAFITAVDLAKLLKLLAEFGNAGVSLSLDDLLVRAAALALEAMTTGDASPTPVVAWETGGAANRREILLPEAHKGLVSALHARLAAALAEAEPPLSPRPAGGLSLRRLNQSGIRPTTMPLLPGYDMRLVVSATGSAPAAECLLCFDARAVSEDDAAALLARVRDSLETPLRLLA
jgi:e3 binding domain